jgi:ABC-type sugar transport system ATPase subunit
VHALRAADLELLPGEVHGVIGPNGAGKSTLAKILAAAIHADSGAIAIDGEEVHLHDPAAAQRHRLVLMPQEIAVVPTASVTDNVTLGAEAGRYGLRSRRACRTNAEAALAAVGLDVDPQALAGTLSAAHQRLLMMARALDRDARLLILDEPNAGLAQHEAELVGAAVRRLLERAVTVIYVSHHLSEVAGLCDRVTCVREGRVTATLTGVEVTKDALVSMLLDVPIGSDAARHSAPVPPSGTDRNGAGGPQVELEGVTGGRLRDVSVCTRSGEVTGVTGLLGSGVAEVVSMIVGSTQPQSGAVRVGGEQMSLTSPATALDRGIGYLAGDRARAAFTGMSIRENVSVAALARWFGRLGLIRRKAERSKVDSHLAALSVRGDPGTPPGRALGRQPAAGARHAAPRDRRQRHRARRAYSRRRCPCASRALARRAIAGSEPHRDRRQQRTRGTRRALRPSGVHPTGAGGGRPRARRGHRARNHSLHLVDA